MICPYWRGSDWSMLRAPSHEFLDKRLKGAATLSLPFPCCVCIEVWHTSHSLLTTYYLLLTTYYLLLTTYYSPLSTIIQTTNSLIKSGCLSSRRNQHCGNGFSLSSFIAGKSIFSATGQPGCFELGELQFFTDITSHSTDETTSHPTKQPKNGCQVVGYNHTS